jgi:hypothetical protein
MTQQMRTEMKEELKAPQVAIKSIQMLTRNQMRTRLAHWETALVCADSHRVNCCSSWLSLISLI